MAKLQLGVLPSREGDLLDTRSPLSQGEQGPQGIAGVKGDSNANDAVFTKMYQQIWQPQASYAAGSTVVNPQGQLMIAKTNFTSGATYNKNNWSFPASSTQMLATSILNGGIL